ncbi:phosphodiester glycosidase family protein [Paenibacillus sp. HN-1]|uniref:stalk domain-containing protein n=1 Tax=Paenibacillus TaxID=44249 RepID=UPI001CAA0E74|nr:MULTISPECIES: stalk domain-containing protein [Paenibacillus]MBY9077620.1 phosphodiester glycosidase family protein [Paenibacillus sp. CGMCC 1.18879]MBY9087996.1 phosphodiester glycosidase family protein [Paenibacillus sinensis]
MKSNGSWNQSQQKSTKLVKHASAKKWIAASLAGVIWIMPVIGEGLPLMSHSTASIVEAATSFSATKVSEDIITSGATKLKYKYSVTRSGSKASGLADVIRIDLNNPYVSIDVMTGKNGNLTTRQSTGGMAKETGAVAAVNGDYFNTSGEGAPIGGEVSGGTLVSTPSQLDGLYAFALTTDRKPMIDEFSFDGTVTAEDGSQLALAGINKGAYNPEGGTSTYSHVNAAYIYTDAWTALDRPKNSSTTPTEVLVENGVITQISQGAALPIAVPEGAYILRTHGTAAQFVASHLAVGQKLTTAYSLRSKTTGQAIDPGTLQMMIGGHTILVNNGKATSFSRSVSSIGGYRARTALGYSQDERYVYIVAVEKNDDSSGMSLTELQSFMTSIGVYKGLNLDGGGSTTMVDRPLAETQTVLSFDTEYGTEQRSVVNGLGVYTNAPQGQVKGIKISGSSVLLVGQSATYSLKGYDTYYNPIELSTGNTSWKSSNGSVSVSGGVASAVKPGTATLTAASGSASATTKVTVLGGDDLSSLQPGTATGPLKTGATLSVPVTAISKSGATISVPASSLKWEFVGFQGSVQEGKLTINSVNPGVTTGYAIARYDGFSTAVVLTTAASTAWEDFENVSYPVAFTTNTQGVQGTAQITAGTGDHAGSKVLSLNYDMTAGSGKMYAYAQLNGTSGRTVPATATSMSVDVMGDKSLNWLRAEFTDAGGSTVYIDLAKTIDWTGWKTINTDLSGYGIKFPAVLKRVYVVNVEEGQDERAKTGTVAFDNISFVMPSLSSEAGLPTGTASMTIGQKSLTVNGVKKVIDSAPLNQNGTTYVPIKYVLDAFGGSATWNSAAKNIMVLRGSKAMELTVNKKEFILNGKRQSAEVAPILLQGRTLVPLRLVSEQLGLTVKWEQKTKTVTIES